MLLHFHEKKKGMAVMFVSYYITLNHPQAFAHPAAELRSTLSSLGWQKTPHTSTKKGKNYYTHPCILMYNPV